MSIAPGVGMNFAYSIRVGGQVSNVFKTTISYRPPSITRVIPLYESPRHGVRFCSDASSPLLGL